jgi:hypothetical protein
VEGRPNRARSSSLGEHWHTLRILLLCDNQAIVHCLVSGSSLCPHVMSLLRSLFLLAAKYNFTVSAQHIPGTHNVIADSLSQFRMQVLLVTRSTGLTQPTPLFSSWRYYLHHSLAPSTHASYSSAQRCFTKFALTYNRLNTTGSPIPVSENTLMLFTPTHKPQSTKLYLSAVHLKHGLPDPTS